MILIGYQGIRGSNSEEAAKLMAKRHGFQDYMLLPLVSSFNVLDNVVSRNIDYGVIAIKNNTGGNVKESTQSLKYMDVELFDTITLPISHFLYVKDETIKSNTVTEIASHSQALIQCQENLQKRFPNVMLKEDEDTATAALKLRLGLLSDTTAVLCRKNAGEQNQLILLESNLEDRSDNTTDFNMYRSKHK